MHEIPIGVLYETFPLSALHLSGPILSLARFLEERPSRCSERRQDRRKLIDHDLEVHPTSVRALQRSCIPAAIALAQHDLRLTPCEVGKPRSRPIIGNIEPEQVAPEAQARIKVLDSQFRCQGRETTSGGRPEPTERARSVGPASGSMRRTNPSASEVGKARYRS